MSGIAWVQFGFERGGKEGPSNDGGDDDHKFADCWRAVVSLGKSPLLCLPFAALALLKTASLVLLYFFWKPPISGFMMSVIRSVFGETEVHYPAHVLRLLVCTERSTWR